MGIMSLGWSSKAGRWANHTRAYGKAHYLGVDEKPLCSKTVYVDGPAIGKFKVEWEPLHPEDELCKRCQRILKNEAVLIYALTGEKKSEPPGAET